MSYPGIAFHFSNSCPWVLLGHDVPPFLSFPGPPHRHPPPTPVWQVVCVIGQTFQGQSTVVKSLHDRTKLYAGGGHEAVLYGLIISSNSHICQVEIILHVKHGIKCAGAYHLPLT
jgi:hypothetical protein